MNEVQEMQWVQHHANRSESIAKLAEALAAAQGMMKSAVKSSENPYFKSKYADLAAVWDAIREPLAANKLAVVQLTHDDGKPGIVVETILMHASGEWISGKLRLKPVKDDPQGVGSCITYARRYGLAIVGVVTDGDDDGNAASMGGPTATHRETPAPPPAKGKVRKSRGPESQIPEVAKTSSITPKITLMSLVGTWVAKHNNSPEPKGEALVAYTRGVLEAIGCQRDGTGRMIVDDAAMLRAIEWCKPRMDKGEAPPPAVG